MNIINTDAYRTAFSEYLRRGTPIRLSLKQVADTERYVWRTQRDERVRPSHRVNDGRILSRSNPPDTGHPGEDYNCRCEAIPYVEGQTEFAFFDLVTDTDSTVDRWENHDFIWHFFAGAGREVALPEIGHLREIVDQYAYSFRLKDYFTDPVDLREFSAWLRERPDRFWRLLQTVGDLVGIGGGPQGAPLEIDENDVSSIFMAVSEMGGTSYIITGEWEAHFRAAVHRERNRSH